MLLKPEIRISVSGKVR